MINRIMLVDGSTASREVLIRRLQVAMPEIHIASCATANEALARIAEERFSLITTALLLPDMDGLDLCRKIRSSKRYRYTPVIVVSSDADQRLLHEGYNAGVTDYFDKARGFMAFGQFIKSLLARNAELYGRILYLEDSKTAIASTRQMLEQHGMEVVHASSVEQALTLLEKSRQTDEKSFDLVITDFHLQGQMTGGDLLYSIRVRQHYSQQELPVLVTTGNEDSKTQVAVFHAGANDFVNKPLVEEVVMARVRALLLVKLQYDTLRRQAANLEQMANTDALTQTHNRLYLVESGETFLNQQNDGWVIIIDLDHFKRINDTQGHLVGDQVLIAMGRLLNQLFQDGLPVRFGGEEFVVLAHGDSMPDRCEAMRKAVEALKPGGVEVTVSIGLVAVEDHAGKDLNSLLGLADKALYAAKEAGRNRLFIYGTEGNAISYSTFDST
ncbi:MAG: response regulator [Candidatus Thiodiazotropha taylori]|nr:response regulator [Candidatus Thiodiazotropha taylori]MCG8108049.1 response regulator [Candidatus Thiodiazotropha taylori]MCG8110077.1 response regulator [Candidatus Thiodiazotropha taylori]MCW4280388.1 response regulator [Candidatus Thiodiazotropha taylori]MCW4282423.1 response regulator [Candidatus Thiodiazotropha taylori]